MKRLQRRSILVTGGAQGAGAASVSLFAREGARVMIADRDGAALDRFVASMVEQGLDVRGVHADVSRAEEAQLVHEAAREAFDDIDILFNHAGIMLVKPFLDCTLDE